jgi:hypothetical protein
VTADELIGRWRIKRLYEGPIRGNLAQFSYGVLSNHNVRNARQLRLRYGSVPEQNIATNSTYEDDTKKNANSPMGNAKLVH